jgi:hypothetical protein
MGQLNTLIMTGRLIVVGDSFCILPGPKDSFKNWVQQVSDQLHMPAVVSAGAGVSQDWQWSQMQQLLRDITPADRIIMVPTHCERQWFVANKPAYTHVNVANLPEELGVEVAEAIRHYCVHLQRLELDLQHQAHRMGWLQAQADRVGAHPIWVLPAFSMHSILSGNKVHSQQYWDQEGISQFPLLLVSPHNLYDHVQELEMQPGESTNSVFKGVDVRYNHLLQHNHEILAHCVVRAVKSVEPITLTDPRWMQHKLHANIWQDHRFVHSQMDVNQLQRREEILNRYEGTLIDKAWYKDWFKK